MGRSEVIQMLRAHEEEFRASGIASISLFGSVARGEDGARDLDLAIRVGPGFSGPGLDRVRALDELEQRLSAMVGCKVDVIEEPVRRPKFQEEIDRDRLRAF